MTFRKFLDIGRKLSSLFSLSLFFVPKLCMYLHGPEFLGHLVVTVSRFRGGKFLFGWKTSRENVDFLTRIIFLGGIPNRRQAIFKWSRAPSGVDLTCTSWCRMHFLWYSWIKKFTRKCWNLWPDLFFQVAILIGGQIFQTISESSPAQANTKIWCENITAYSIAVCAQNSAYP